MQVVIAPGPPSLGKSTYFRKQELRVISPDAHVYNADGIYEWTPDRAKAAWDRAYEECREAIANGQSFAFDATLVSVKARAAFISKLREYGYRDPVVAVNLPDPGIEVLVERDAVRPNKHNVGRGVIERMYSQWQRPTDDENGITLFVG